MSGFLSKILSPLNLSNKNTDPSLKQGARFNIMQNTITRPTYSNLHIINQTTGNGLGSVTEGMKNIKLNYSKSLDDLDKKEVEKLAAKEGSYNDLINTMQEKQNQLNKDIMYDHSQSIVKKLIDEINKLDDEIMQKANEISQDAMKSNNANNNVDKSMQEQSNILHQQLMKLKERRQGLNNLIQKEHDLDGQIENRRNELDSSYLTYLTWFICATTLGVLAVRQLSK